MNLNKLAYLVRYYWRAELLGQKKPILGGIKITYKCNLTCPQCPYWHRKYKEVGFQKLVGIMDKMFEAGVRILILEGGEPLLWRDGEYRLEDLVIEAKRRFFTVGLTTNGTMPIETNADVVWVSVDGLRATHNQLRSNSFDRVMTTIENSRHLKIFANITINKINAGEVPELVKFLKGKVKGITIQFFYPYQESEDLMLSQEQRVEVLEKLIELKRQGYPLNDSITALEALKYNTWHCEPWMLCNGEPDGTINWGCYLRNRTDEQDPCKHCGFAAHTEISLAYQGSLGALWSGKNILDIF